jgi:hypothetical protein
MQNRAPERTERPQRTPPVLTLSAAFVADCRADWRRP